MANAPHAPPTCNHNPELSAELSTEPDDYISWLKWASERKRTHEYVKCKSCGAWVWVEKKKEGGSQGKGGELL